MNLKKTLLTLLLIISFSYAKDRALIIGCCSEYQYLQQSLSLQGTKNDAKHIYDILLSRGVKADNIDYILEKEATRNNIISKLSGVESSDLKLGDRFYIFYSGHGTSVGDRSRFGKKITKDKEVLKWLENSAGFITYDFNPKDIANTLLIAKRDFRPSFEKLDKRGVKVIWIADACYAGNSYRSGENITNKFIKLDPKLIAQAKQKIKREKKPSKLYNHLLFFGASLSTLPTQEIFYNNEKRGAFSVEIEKCLNEYYGEGVILNSDLKKCLKLNYANSQFEPSFYPTKDKKAKEIIIKAPLKAQIKIEKRSFREKLFSLKSSKPLLDIEVKSLNSSSEIIKTFCNHEILSVDIKNKLLNSFVIAFTMDNQKRVIMLQPDKKNLKQSSKIIKTEVQPPFGKDKIKIFTTTNREIYNIALGFSNRKYGLLSSSEIEIIYNSLAKDMDFRTANIEVKTIKRDIKYCLESD